MNGADIASDWADEIASLLSIMAGKGKPLDVKVKRPAEIMHDPLADAGNQVLLDVGADCVNSANSNHDSRRQFQNRYFVIAHSDKN